MTNVLQSSPHPDPIGDSGLNHGGDAGVMRCRRTVGAVVKTVVLMSFAVLPLHSNAATIHANLSVSVMVLATCKITATQLAFGVYTGAADLEPATLTITCTNTTTYTVALNTGQGNNPVANVATRHMNGPAATGLAYALYRDASCTLNWGQTNGTDTVAGTGTGSAQVLTVYGRISAGQFITPGAYSDTVIATITY